jgi:hypothetical protein
LPTQLLGLDRPGRTRIRCLALRADADDGIVNASTVLMDTGRVLVHGTGTLNLRDEGIAMRLRSMLRVGIPVVVPVRVGGTFLDAKVASDVTGAAGAIASERSGDTCAPALAAARGGPRQVLLSR